MPKVSSFYFLILLYQIKIKVYYNKNVRVFHGGNILRPLSSLSVAVSVLSLKALFIEGFWWCGDDRF